ncbi:MAG: XTP/dITP diphosphatase [Waddliaceae bacterium]|jgi:XTP/dITP diphosphohydrolase|nr:XTP/dITP diphosphatase [Waddliaceae bacterium]MBT3579628.1 XTP/dITP diphosphatase [Waddliaceae bacterium]MBT4444606.1 XTP/dITP diphosphatase [Waddliaceae bacterium]MBT6928127.1 XTP/dITP diphosphatase [Waddliaceae bacterium]MBT7264689.1 XTP/dITP diphosphatase [Waddliaceae bacterium]
MRCIIASNNLHKIREYREMFKSVPDIELLSLRDFPEYVAPEETGKTFEENANIKAEHAAKNLGEFVIADDSGLVVPALDGAPGVYSARYAGEGATDADNRNKLLEEMEGYADLQRAAFFECCISMIGPGGKKHIVTARCEGVVLEEGRGGSGFGYDPLFLKNDYDKTFAELDESTKNRVSHRFKAFDKITPFIESLIHKENNDK